MNTETVNKLIATLAAMAAAAADKAETGVTDNTPDYWQGVLFGLETAIVELRLALDVPADTESGALSISEASILSMDDAIDEGDYP